MKYTLFVANVLILFGGIAVLSVGIWVCTGNSTFEKLMDGHLMMSAAYILIATGCIVIIISVIGCLGAVREIKCLLLTYFIILFILFVIMLVGGILGAVFKNMVRDKMKSKMMSTQKNDYRLQPDVKAAWDTVQIELKCCGIKWNATRSNIQSWLESDAFSADVGKPKLPESCCRRNSKNTYDENVLKTCQEYDTTITDWSNNIYTEDCYDKMSALVEEYAVVLGAIGITVAFILLMGMIFSMVVFKMIE